MNPSPKRRSVVLGLFTIGAVSILAAGILMIGSLNDSFTRRVTVSAVFDQVNGLKKGDNIWFSGMKVGIVRRLDFEEEARVRVEMRIDEEAATHIRNDVLATIGSDGLIGNRIVVLNGGTAAVPALADGDVLVVGDAFGTEDIIKMLKENSTNLLAITTDIKDLTGGLREGKGSLGKLLQDDSLYANVNASVVSLGRTADSARGASASLAVFTRELNREGNLPHELVTDRDTFAKLTDTVDQLQLTSQRASALVGGLAEGAADPATPLGALTRDEQAGTDLKGTLRNMDAASATLNEDLLGLQHSILLRGYFRRKARAEAREGHSKRRAESSP